MTRNYPKRAVRLTEAIARAEDDRTKRRAARWLEENRAAIEDWNAWVEANGLPLADMRLF